jgi:hypothetical protein
MDLTDQDTIVKAQAQLNRCALDLAKLSNDVADARTVREFSGDRLKRAFSIEVSRFLESGESAAASEHKARASTQYGEHLADLMAQHKEAQRVIEQHEGLRVQFEAARSILSVEKSKLGLL